MKKYVVDYKDSQEGLHADETLLRQFVENTPATIEMFDNEMRYLLVSNRFLQDFGFQGQDVIGRSHYEVFPESIRWKDIHQRGLAGETIRCDEDLLIRDDGTREWLKWEVQPWRDQNGRIGGIIIFTEVITERKEAEEALKRSEERYRNLFERSPIPTWEEDFSAVKSAFDRLRSSGVTDFRSYFEENPQAVRHLGALVKIVDVNMESVQFFEVASKEEVPAYLPFYFTEESWEVFKEEMIVLARGGTRFECEIPIRDVRGEVKLASLRLSVAPGCEETLSTVLVSFVDITSRKQAEVLSAALNSVNAAISSTLNFDKILRSAVVESARVLRADSAAVSLREGDHWFSSYVYNLPDHTLGIRYSSKDGPALAAVMQSREPVVIDDMMAEDIRPEFVLSLGIRSVMFVPLILRDEVIGILHFHRHDRPSPFTEVDIDFARKLATSISLALENARLYEAKQVQFSMLQQALIPDLPQIGEGYSVAAVYESASEGQEIGGDFYDVLSTEAGKQALLIGDVAGKDIEAAELAAATRNTLRAFAYELSSAADALTHANAVAFARKRSPMLFATAFLAVLDGPTGHVVYSSAGHPPAAVYRAEGRVEFLNFGPPPMGIVDKLVFTEARTDLRPGDKLVLYTDGISEARCGQEMFETAGVERTLLEHGHRTPSEVAQALVDAAQEWAHGDLRDDIAILVVGRTAPV